MSAVAYVKPSSLAEAYSARAAHPEYSLLAGGTDFMVGILHRAAPAGVIDLFGLGELCGVERRASSEGGEELRIGAGTTYAQLLASSELCASFPLLTESAREIGATQIQERGTLGGNMGTSSPVGDTLPVLLALDAVVEVGSARGQRRIPYAEFCTGYRQTAMASDELIVAVCLPLPGPAIQFWRKVGTRKAQAISKVMVAAAGRLEEGLLRDVRIAMGAVADRPVRLRVVEGLCEGQAPSERLAETVRQAVAEAITPISDIRSSAPYRLRAAQNLAARFILEQIS